jgi:hypothetical protein
MQATMRTLPPARRKLLTIVLATLLGIVLLYTIVGFVVVPRVLEQQLPGISEKRLGVRAQWHEVTFNPFLLKLSARDLRLDTRDGQRLGSAQRISIDLQWAALFRREPLLDALQIEAPDVWIVRAADGSLNLPPRSASAKSRASATPSPLRLPRLRVNEATVHRGVVHFLDRSVQPEARSDVSAMDIELLSLTTETDKDGRG